MLDPSRHRLALLMHGHLRRRQGKMGFGLLRYGDTPVVAAIDAEEVEAHRGSKNGAQGVPTLAEVTGIDHPARVVSTVDEALALGANVIVIAVATTGGVLPAAFRADLAHGLRAGMSVVNGLHGRLGDDPEFAIPLAPGQFIWDLRLEPEGLLTGSGAARHLTTRRVLTVGTDMAIGKMTASLELHRAAQARGLRSHFVATGQIGIAISGAGVPLDAVRVDFASGSIEQQCLRFGGADGPGADVLWIEGQGSAIHPASTAWVPLLRGSVPTALTLVHRAGQTALDRFSDVAIPPLAEVIALYEAVARAGGSLVPARVTAIALNCGHLDDAAAQRAVAETADLTGLPTADVVRSGGEALLDAALGTGRPV